MAEIIGTYALKPSKENNKFYVCGNPRVIDDDGSYADLYGVITNGVTLPYKTLFIIAFAFYGAYLYGVKVPFILYVAPSLVLIGVLINKLIPKYSTRYNIAIAFHDGATGEHGQNKLLIQFKDGEYRPATWSESALFMKQIMRVEGANIIERSYFYFFVILWGRVKSIFRWFK